MGRSEMFHSGHFNTTPDELFEREYVLHKTSPDGAHKFSDALNGFNSKQDDTPSSSQMAYPQLDSIVNNSHIDPLKAPSVPEIPFPHFVSLQTSLHNTLLRLVRELFQNAVCFFS